MTVRCYSSNEGALALATPCLMWSPLLCTVWLLKLEWGGRVRARRLPCLFAPVRVPLRFGRPRLLAFLLALLVREVAGLAQQAVGAPLLAQDVAAGAAGPFCMPDRANGRQLAMLIP